MCELSSGTTFLVMIILLFPCLILHRHASAFAQRRVGRRYPPLLKHHQYRLNYAFWSCLTVLLCAGLWALLCALFRSLSCPI